GQRGRGEAVQAGGAAAGRVEGVALGGEEQVVAGVVDDDVGAFELVVDPVGHEQGRAQGPRAVLRRGEGDGAGEGVLPGGGGGDQQVVTAVGGVAEPARVAEGPDAAGCSFVLVRRQIDVPVGAQDLPVRPLPVR